MEEYIRSLKVIILSLSIQTLTSEYGKYFGVDAYSMTVNDRGKKCEVDFSNLADFKLNFVKKFPKEELVVIADFKHDIPIFNYAKGGKVVVLKKYQKWMESIKEGFLLQV